MSWEINGITPDAFNKKDIATDQDIASNTPNKILDATRILNENTMLSESAFKAPSQLSVVNYIANQVAGGVTYRGTLSLPDTFATMTSNSYLAGVLSVATGDMFVALTDGILTMSDGTITVSKGDALIINTDSLKTATTVAMIDDISPSYPTVSVGDSKDSWVIADHEGWLLEDGRAISRVTYADLFALIGISQGAGDGSTTFNLPDSRGRVTTGSGQGTGLTNRVLGSKFGTENETLDISQIPSHLHTNDHGHSHNHTVSDINPGGKTSVSGPGLFNNRDVYDSEETNTQTTSTRSLSYTGNTGSVGGGQSHNNMQPSIAKNVFVYVGV
jgi:microcystin-dependent protein